MTGVTCRRARRRRRRGRGRRPRAPRCRTSSWSWPASVPLVELVVLGDWMVRRKADDARPPAGGVPVRTGRGGPRWRGRRRRTSGPASELPDRDPAADAPRAGGPRRNLGSTSPSATWTGRARRRFDLSWPDWGRSSSSTDGRHHVERRGAWEVDLARREEIDDHGCADPGGGRPRDLPASPGATVDRVVARAPSPGRPGGAVPPVAGLAPALRRPRVVPLTTGRNPRPARKCSRCRPAPPCSVHAPAWNDPHPLAQAGPTAGTPAAPRLHAMDAVPRGDRPGQRPLHRGADPGPARRRWPTRSRPTTRARTCCIVGILRGAVMVMADLARALPTHVEMDWMAVSSYGSGTKSSGVVRILKDLDTDISGRHVLDRRRDHRHRPDAVLAGQQPRQPRRRPASRSPPCCASRRR